MSTLKMLHSPQNDLETGPGGVLVNWTSDCEPDWTAVMNRTSRPDQHHIVTGPVCLCVLWLAAEVPWSTWWLEAPGSVLHRKQEAQLPASRSLSEPDHVCTFLVLLPFVYFTAQHPSHLHIHAPTWTPLIMLIETHSLLITLSYNKTWTCQSFVVLFPSFVAVSTYYWPVVTRGETPCFSVIDMFYDWLWSSSGFVHQRRETDPESVAPSCVWIHNKQAALILLQRNYCWICDVITTTTTTIIDWQNYKDTYKLTECEKIKII